MIELHLSGPGVPPHFRPLRALVPPAHGSRLYAAQYLVRDGAEDLVEVEGVVVRVDWHYPHNVPPFAVVHLRSL